MKLWKSKLPTNLHILKIASVIATVQLLVSWFALFAIGGWATGKAEVAATGALVMMSFIVIPIFVSTLSLTLCYRYGIMHRLKDE